MVELSVVVPVYECEGCLRELHRRLTESVRPVTGSYEIVLVDDRSTDGSWEVIRELATADPAVRPIRLSRNFGQHAAITAGLSRSAGERVVVMDCDLEDPPEEIPRLVAKAQEGYDAVLSKRRHRRQTLFRRLSARAYRRLANRLARADMDPDYTNLSIISRKVVDSFLAMRDLDRQYLLIVLWLGFDHATIEVDQSERYAGKSSYALASLVRVGIDGLVFQTTRLLTLIVYGGFVIAGLGTLAAGSLILYSYVVYEPPPGWASLAVMTMVLTGVIVVSTGITGLYVGKIFSQVKGRPLYVVDVDATTASRDEQRDPAPLEAGSSAGGERPGGEQLGPPRY